jgi:hypothetical protein
LADARYRARSRRSRETPAAARVNCPIHRQAEGRHITTTNLYNVCVEHWLQREGEDKQRTPLDGDTRRKLMIELTWRLWINERASINYRDLLPFVQKLCAERQVDFTDDEQREAVARQMQAATFLKRDPGGEFIWMHPSFGEYFLAWKILEALREGDCRVLATRRFDRKTIGCLAPLDTARVLIEPLQRIVTGKYQKQISENAATSLRKAPRL